MNAKIYLVGAGPGDPELLTVKAHKLLVTADVVYHDRLVSDEILSLVPRHARLVDVGKRPYGASTSQNVINEMLVEAALSNDSVVRLKGGDPLVFGRGAEEADYLVAHGIDVEIVPGISSALGVPTAAGVPITRRGVASGFAVVTGHQAENKIDWSRLTAVETLVILMGVRNRANIANALIAAGRPAEEPILFIERGTTPRERRITGTLGEVAEGRTIVYAPAIWIVGAVTGRAGIRRLPRKPSKRFPISF